MDWTKREISAMETVLQFGKMSKGQLMPYLLKGFQKDEYLRRKQQYMRESRKTLLEWAITQFKTEGWAK